MTGQAMTPEVIAAVFCAVLDLDDVRPSDSFFDIGGSSFTALTLVAKLNAGSAGCCACVTCFVNRPRAAWPR